MANGAGSNFTISDDDIESLGNSDPDEPNEEFLSSRGGFSRDERTLQRKDVESSEGRGFHVSL